MAHDALERFQSIVPEGDAMVRLMETESDALDRLGQHYEAVALSEYCFKTRTEHPERFQDGDKLPFNSFSNLAHNLAKVGRLDEAEATLKKALAGLESDGIEFHSNVIQAMDALGGVYRLQGRKKEAAAMRKAVKKLVPQVYPKDHPEYKRFME
jgi:tetratricopeptide (TPR) repeat protein